MSEENVSRRVWLKIAGGTIVGLAVGAAGRIPHSTRQGDLRDVIPYFKQPDKNGVALDEERFSKLMDEYYMLRGWDPKTGWPTREKLEELSLKDVADELEESGLLS